MGSDEVRFGDCFILRGEYYYIFSDIVFIGFRD